MAIGRPAKVAQWCAAVAFAGAGTYCVVRGLLFLREGTVLAGVSVLVMGTALVGLGLASLRMSRALTGWSLMVGGLAQVGLGAALVGHDQPRSWVLRVAAALLVIAVGLAGISIGATVARLQIALQARETDRWYQD